MTVLLARIDQRLVHGLTVNQWKNELNPTRYMVIDDHISQDETTKAGMRLSKPAGTAMSIINLETAINNFKGGNYDTHRVFILVKEPDTILKLIEAGVEIPKVNVGIIFNEDGRVPVTKRVALNKEEAIDLQAIASKGYDVTLQYSPEDAPVALDKALEKFSF